MNVFSTATHLGTSSKEVIWDRIMMSSSSTDRSGTGYSSERRGALQRRRPPSRPFKRSQLTRPLDAREEAEGTSTRLPHLRPVPKMSDDLAQPVGTGTAPGCQRAASGRVTSSDRGQGGCQRPGRTPASRTRRVGALTGSRPHPGEEWTLARTAPPSRSRTWTQHQPASRTAPVLTANKYRSHEQQVPFSRRISTVLAVRGWGG